MLDLDNISKILFIEIRVNNFTSNKLTRQIRMYFLVSKSILGNFHID